MDSISQIQSYLRTLAATFSTSIQFLYDSSPVVQTDLKTSSVEKNDWRNPTVEKNDSGAELTALKQSQMIVEKVQQLFQLIVESEFVVWYCADV